MIRRLGVAFAVAIMGIVAWCPDALGPVPPEPGLVMTPGPNGPPVYRRADPFLVRRTQQPVHAQYPRRSARMRCTPTGVLPVDDTTCDGNTVAVRLGSRRRRRQLSGSGPTRCISCPTPRWVSRTTSACLQCRAAMRPLHRPGPERLHPTEDVLTRPLRSVRPRRSPRDPHRRRLGWTPSGASAPAGGSGAHAGASGPTSAPPLCVSRRGAERPVGRGWHPRPRGVSPVSRLPGLYRH